MSPPADTPPRPAPPPALVLASASPARRMLLSRIAGDFDVMPADIDETRQTGEPPRALAVRLARGKAERVAAMRADTRVPACVIGSDQVAECDGALLDKPGTPEACVDMLMRLSGREAHFFTAVHVVGASLPAPMAAVDFTRVVFRTLTRDEASRYVAVDRPWHCAGGFKAEAAGITLFRRIESNDPTALVGLPLIFVAEALRAAGFSALPG